MDGNPSRARFPFFQFFGGPTADTITDMYSSVLPIWRKSVFKHLHDPAALNELPTATLGSGDYALTVSLPPSLAVVSVVAIVG